MKQLYVLDGRLTYRSSQFYACCERYCRNIQLIRPKRLSFVNDLPSRPQDYLIFVNFSHEYPHTVYPLLARYDLLGRTVVVGVEDVPLRIAWGGEAAILELTGQAADQDEHHVPGWGFVPEIPPTVAPAIPFEKKSPVYYFRGRLHGISRVKFLAQIRERQLHTKIIAQLPDDAITHDHDVRLDMLERCCDCLVNRPAPPYDYLTELNRYRFCLSPLGYGHTYRILEGMAMGCLVVVDQVQHLRFCRDFFRPGENCLETGDNCQQLDLALARCEDTAQVAEIAANGKQTFDRYFRCVHGTLPSVTFLPMIRQLDRMTKGFFSSTILFA